MELQTQNVNANTNANANANANVKTNLERVNNQQQADEMQRTSFSPRPFTETTKTTTNQSSTIRGRAGAASAGTCTVNTVYTGHGKLHQMRGRVDQPTTRTNVFCRSFVSFVFTSKGTFGAHRYDK